MRRRMLTGAALLALMTGALPGARPAPAEAANLCLAYCETIYVGCLATVGALDRSACTEWREGCREGCRAPLQVVG